MIEWTQERWDSFMNPAKNVLKSMPVEQRFSLSMILSGLWSLAFCIYIGEIMMIAPYMLGHFALLAAVMITWLIFKWAEKRSLENWQQSKKNKVIWFLDREA
tara:strand:- start:241 stop:546 length:306 start_codon:yes stop_codon:yes gene_type:complete